MRSIWLFILFCILSLLLINHEAGAKIPLAEDGVLDLRTLKKNQEFYIKLNGEWEFYWNKKLHPSDFKHSSFKPDCFGKVPSYWTSYKTESIKTEKFGYATYRLTILLPEGFKEPLAIDLPVFDSSYDIYLNGRYLGGNGVPGVTAVESIPEYRRNFFRITPSDTVEVVINVTNFDHRRGGFWLPVKFGTFSVTQKSLANSWALQWAVISLLVGFSIFFLFFFIISPHEKNMLFFSIATLGLAIRPLFTNHYMIQNFFTMEWSWIVRFEYLGLFAILLGWGWFVVNLYYSRFIYLINWINTILISLTFLLTLVLPVKIFSYSAIYCYPIMVILTIYPLVKSLAGTFRKNLMDIMYLFAFIVLLFGVFHDIRVALGKAENAGYLLSYIVVLFIFIQAILLQYKWVRSFYEKEKLQNELEFMNKNLEIIVNERTQELKARSQEIEKQNTMIALQNKRLSETIHIKNRIFSVIAHDLRSPVVNILYMLNLLKEKEYKEKYDTFANSSIEYAQMVINLLENMLVWGREQEDKIKYSPERQNIADLIFTNLSIFKETADKKDISVNFTQVGSSIAYFDKDLLDIVIRNILSNAVKYTQRGGRISILLKDKSSTSEGIMLKICDNGIGISETRQKNLFSASEIESTAGTENEKGTGLGLKLCYDLIRLNKGSISVESAPGEGTCFMISLPA